MLPFQQYSEKRPNSASRPNKYTAQNLPYNNYIRNPVCGGIMNINPKKQNGLFQLRNSIIIGKRIETPNSTQEIENPIKIQYCQSDSQKILVAKTPFSREEKFPVFQSHTFTNFPTNLRKSMEKPRKISSQEFSKKSERGTNSKISVKEINEKRIAFLKKEMKINDKAQQKKTDCFTTKRGESSIIDDLISSTDTKNFFHEINDKEMEENEIDRSFSIESFGASSNYNPLKPNEPYLLKSIYQNRPFTLFFNYHPICNQTHDLSRVVKMGENEMREYDFNCRISGETPLKCVELAFKAGGFKITTEGKDWNVFWGFVKPETLKNMNPFQKTNHFPGCWHLGRKDNLYRHIFRMKQKYEEHYNFIPKTYLLSSEYKRFQMIRKTSDKKALWIMKPVNSSCGRGVKVIDQKSKLPFKKDFLVSEYINNPHLINGLKYDLRVYVVITSFDPLRVYCYNEGLVRFATEKYTLSKKKIKKRFIHLTNFSVNKKALKYKKNINSSVDGEGSKWSFSAYKKKLIEIGSDPTALFKKIHDLIVKVCIATESYMSNGNGIIKLLDHRNNCFELFGFDILIDNNLKPWLMEVNVSPSLSSSSPLDAKIKTSLICDILNLIGLKIYNKKKIDEEKIQKEKKIFSSYNPSEIANINYQNCLQKLTIDQWNILFENEEEFARKGQFQRIFPDKENLDFYSQFFESPGINNLIWWKYLKSDKDFLELICKKEKI